MKKKISIIIAVILVAIVGFVLITNSNKNTDQVSNVKKEESKKASEGKDFSDLIVVDSPQVGGFIQTTFLVAGKARGPWFSEGSFPVTLKDDNGNIISQTSAGAEGEWMTEEFVPFSVYFTFTKPGNVTKGILILEKSNPSGLPENAEQIEIPVTF
jgi:hypothetical protein